MSQDYSPFRLGAVEYPLTSGSSKSSVEYIDSVLVAAVNWWTGSLNTNVLPMWNYEVQKLQEQLPARSPEVQKLSGSFVREVYFGDPTSVFNVADFKFPLLSVYKMHQKFGYITSAIPRKTVTCGLDIIFPPLSYPAFRRLRPLLDAAADVLFERTLQGYDGNLDNGTIPWFEAVSDIGFDEAAVVDNLSDAFPQIDQKANLRQPILHMQFTYNADKRFTVTGSLSKFTQFNADVFAVTGTNDPHPFSGSWAISASFS